MYIWVREGVYLGTRGCISGVREGVYLRYERVSEGIRSREYPRSKLVSITECCIRGGGVIFLGWYMGMLS